MINTKGTYNYDFRPNSYFEMESPVREILSRIKGQRRREFAERLLEEGTVEEIPDFLLKDDLTEGERLAVGSIHPQFMSGEYLPDLEDNEVEIARVVLKSVTGDVISIRARPKAGSIEYRVIDEYEDEGYVRYKWKARSSELPLTLRDIIEFIDSVEIVDGDEVCGYGLTSFHRDSQLEGCEPEDIVDFVTVESHFYSELAAYYEEEALDWLERTKAEYDQGDEEGRGSIRWANRDEYIRRHILNSYYEGCVSSANHGLGEKQWREIYDYVEECLHRTGTLPTGDHRIMNANEGSDGLEVSFPDSDLQFE